ncbi:MAG: Na/Pi symporter [Firmicutes bacterium]|nr:Na/Pi symporter [Bacillota bacterium]MDH7495649.1 Na/Pi symporter [Bacillota bacterium]
MASSLCRLLAGVGLFLVGVRLLRAGLAGAAGKQAEGALRGLTRTPLAGTATGAVVTAVLQSSSAVTAMVVGLVDAEVLDLYQAFGVIMGANLGTCVTAQIASFRAEALGVPAVCAGLVMYLGARRPRSRDMGAALAGLGCILWGAGVTSSAMAWVGSLPWVVESLVVLGQVPALGVVAGTVLAGLIQSSSVITVVLVGLSRQGIVGLESAVAVALGSNVGTCVTTLAASLGASRTARKAAILHLAFNAVGVACVLPVFGPFIRLVEFVSGLDPGRGIANAHTLFNLLSIAAILPWSRTFVDLVKGGTTWTS